MRLRVSIRMLLAVVTLVAVTLAAWQRATETWANVVFNLTVLALLVASFKARYSRGTEGASYFGFALCGWAYLVLAVVSKSLMAAHHHLETPADALLSKVVNYMGQELLGIPDASGAPRSRYLILQCLIALVHALLGAAVFRFFATRTEMSGRPREDA